MVSLEPDARMTDGTSAYGETGETLRGPGFVQCPTPYQDQERGLNPALCPQSCGTGCTHTSWGLWVRCVGVHVWTGYGVEWSPSAA